MITKTVPQCADYQRAIYESLCRIEDILRGQGRVAPRLPHASPLTIDEAAKALRVSRSTMKQLIGNGAIRVIRIGRRVLVARESLQRLLSGQP
jgi:excisionase family DNA binding protein